MPMHAQTPVFSHRSARCLSFLLLSTLEFGLSYRADSQRDLGDLVLEPALAELNSTLSPAHQQDKAANKTGPNSSLTDRLDHGNETQAANRTGPNSSLTDRPDHGNETQPVLLYTANSAEEANPAGSLVPASALVAIGRTKGFLSSVKRLVSGLTETLHSVVDVAATFVGHAADQVGIASGVLLLAGKTVSSSIIDFIGWGGVAAGGWSAVNAMHDIVSVKGTCQKVVQGAKLVVSLGSTGLCIATMLCTSGIGGTLAGVAAGAMDTLWMVLEPALKQWCDSGSEDDDVEVAFEAKDGLNSEDDVKKLMNDMLTVRDGGCGRKSDIYLTPEDADRRYKASKVGFGAEMQQDMDDAASCPPDLLSRRTGGNFSNVNWYCTTDA